MIFVVVDIPSGSMSREPFVAPLICNDAVSAFVSPLCCEQPLACIFTADVRCFFRGGDDTPPSSDSEDDARLATLYAVFVQFDHTNKQHKIMS